MDRNDAEAGSPFRLVPHRRRVEFEIRDLRHPTTKDPLEFPKLSIDPKGNHRTGGGPSGRRQRDRRGGREEGVLRRLTIPTVLVLYRFSGLQVFF